MFVWRIAKRARALDRSGFGASIKGQRWNSANIPAIYAGLTPEIAALEKLVHTGSILPLDLVVVRIELPDDKALYVTPDARCVTDKAGMPCLVRLLLPPMVMHSCSRVRSLA